MSESTGGVDKILEGLSQEERLKLLERIIQGAAEVREEQMTVEERLDRLEEMVLHPGHRHGHHHHRHHHRRHHAHRGPRMFVMRDGCGCH